MLSVRTISFHRDQSASNASPQGRSGWRQPGTGTVFTFTIQHREASGFEGQAPYVVAMVDLDEGPRMMSRIVGPEPISIGMSVEVGWASIADGVDVPVFVSAQELDS